MPLPCPTPGCTRTMPGHLMVCRACSTCLIRDLADVPSLAHHLDLALTRQTHIGEHGGARGTETALPWDQRAAEASAILRSTLVGWVWLLSDGAPLVYGPRCRVCDHPSCEWTDLGRLPIDTLAGLALWLLRHRSRLLGHRAAPEAVDELRAAVRQARRAIDLPPGLWYAGPCVCGAGLYARHGAHYIRCRACGTTIPAADQEAWLLDQAADHLGTATEIARMLNGFREGLTAAMIRGYAHRRGLAVRGRSQAGHPLYRIGDVRKLLAGQRLTLGPTCRRCEHRSCGEIRGETERLAG